MGGKWQQGEAQEGDSGFYTIVVDSVQVGFCRKLLATRGGALGRHGELSLGMGSVASVVYWFGRNRIVISVCVGRLGHAWGKSMGEGARQERRCDMRLMLCPFVCGAAQK
jgi:hypothetical protein